MANAKKTSGKKYHIHKEFLNTPLLMDVLNVYQISEMACLPGKEILEHPQFCHEISYIIAGTGVFLRNGNAFDVAPGNLFLVRRGDFHAIRSSKTDPLRFICFAFNFNRESASFSRFEPVSRFFETLENPVGEAEHDFYPPLSVALRELVTPQEAFSHEIAQSCLMQALLSTYRSFHPQPVLPPAAPDDTVNPLVYEIIAYVEDHLFTLENLRELSDALGYSYGYLSKKFSAVMGMPILSYYTSRRLETATEMLDRGESITRTAEKLCFADTQSFSKAFRKHYKLTPGAYQKKVKMETRS